MTRGSGGQDQRGISSDARDALDEAVRCLAVDAGGLRERILSAALALGKVPSTDFRDHEERRLIDRVRLGLMQLDLTEQGRGGLIGARPQTWEQTLESVASDILDLHELAMSRAITEACLRA